MGHFFQKDVFVYTPYFKKSPVCEDSPKTEALFKICYGFFVSFLILWGSQTCNHQQDDLGHTLVMKAIDLENPLYFGYLLGLFVWIWQKLKIWVFFFNVCVEITVFRSRNFENSPPRKEKSLVVMPVIFRGVR